MAEYWKSTRSYWCKFCAQYVRDTGLERKNHEASTRHQNNIQRSIRDLSKNKDREEREKQRAKAEVARLNGLVGGNAAKPSPSSAPKIIGAKDLGSSQAAPASSLSSAQQRKLHAEQLLALGVEVPEELKKEITGVGGWQTVSERVVEDDHTAGRSLGDIVKDEHDSKDDVKVSIPLIKGVHKRKAEEEEVADQTATRKAWGSRMKTYPGDTDADDPGDLDALLSGVTKKTQEQEDVKNAERDGVKDEDADEKPLSTIPDIDAPEADIKQESDQVEAPVVFKKRKVKK